MIEIKLPISLLLREQIKNNYLEAIKSCSEDEVEYVKLKINKTVARLARSTNTMERQLCSVSIALYRVMVDETEVKVEDHHKDIIAALFYLCNPYDVIPDFDLERGYLDDSLVVNLCLSRVKKQSKSTFDKVYLMVAKGLDSV